MVIKRATRPPPPIPPGVWVWLTDQKYDPAEHSRGRLQIYIQDRAELVHPSQRRVGVLDCYFSRHETDTMVAI
jgi:hypothetical protein